MGLKEIAKKSNVSLATVSLALNDRPGIGFDTRKKILKIAEEMNYRIPEKRTLPRSDNGTIQFLKLSKHGEILNNDLNIFIVDYIDGIDQIVKQMGYKFEISSHTTEELDIVVKETAKKKLQGMIILGTELSYSEVKSLNKIPIPIVIIDTNYDFLAADFVDMNNIGALHKIISYFVETGHRRIGMVTSKITSGNIILREQGFVEAMKLNGLKTDVFSMIRLRPSFEHAYEDMLEHLRKGYDAPEALFCSNDIIAYGCIKALKEKGLKVPEDVSVIGFDDLPISAMMVPQLTTMRVSKKRIGSIAMQLLVEKIDSNYEYHPVSVQVSGILVKRESVINRNT